MNNKLTRTIFTSVAAFLFASVVQALASSKEKISQQLDVQPGGKLVVDVDFGAINVSPGTDDKVTIDTVVTRSLVIPSSFIIRISSFHL